MKICEFPGCGRKHYSKGLCNSHYAQHRKGKEVTTLQPDVPIEERFMKYVEKTDTCWLWKGFIHVEGYGKFKVYGKMQLAHRVAYELFIGPIPTGETVHHKCAVAKCTNPDHLELATLRANIGEMHARRAYEARIEELEKETRSQRERVEELEYALNKQLETVTSLRARTNRLRRIHS